MAKFGIISKDGTKVRFEGKPRYIGTYLRPSYLEFSEIASPTPIKWEVGDFVDYSRTGMRYRLYSIPQASKNARKGSRGNAFTYSNVQLFSSTKDLEIALFRDIVENDNDIHFSTSPDVATFENVEGIIRRIQACMDDLYPGKWEIRLAEFDAVADAEIIEKIGEAKDFALSNGTCLDALSKIYEMWEDLGWFHSYENGKEVITIGYANRRNAENTTESYLYGKGNGLTAIKKSQTNKDEFATRLYIYGSERNLPARYYNGKDIRNAESVDIRNLMLPLDTWGKTNGKPDAKKAYLENADAVAKFGVIPKIHYFDSVDSGADIYPSIEKMTIGQVRKALSAIGTSEYYPSTSYYPNADERIDAIRSVVNPSDNGFTTAGTDSKQYKYQWVVNLSEKKISCNIPGAATTIPVLTNYLLYNHTAKTDFSGGEVALLITRGGEIRIPNANFKSDSVTVNLEVRTSSDSNYEVMKEAVVVAQYVANGNYWSAQIPKIKVNYPNSYQGEFPVYVYLNISATRTSSASVGAVNVTIEDSEVVIGINDVLEKTFHVTLKQVGFNINLQAARGKGKTLSMKTGACAGRDFEISSCWYWEDGDYWALDLKRQQDDTLGLLFPNKDYEIAAGDEFVLLDIAMPETYIYTASDRLLAEGEKLLARASKIQSHYEPSIDAKVMVESGRTLREGMFMQITDEDVIDSTTDYIIIDTLSIYEDESAIPTYKVTLRERRKVTYKGTPSATSTNDTKSVDDGSDEDVDLTGYAKESWVEDLTNGISEGLSELSAKLASMWTLEEDNVLATKQVRIKNDLIIEGDASSGGIGDPSTNIGGITGVRVNGTLYEDENNDGVIDLGIISGGEVDVDLTDYYTKEETNTEITKAVSAIDLSPYATKKSLEAYTAKSDYDAFVESTNSELASRYTKTEIDNKNFATQGYVSSAIANLNITQYAKASDLTAVGNRVTTLESYFSSSEDADSQINKWNEIVAFLNATEGTTLAGILDAYTLKSVYNAFVASTESAIANRYTKAEVNSAISSVDNKYSSTKAWVDTLASLIVNDGGNVRIKANLIVEGDSASGGVGGGTSVGISGITLNGKTYTDVNGDGIIDLGTITSGLTSVSWTDVQGRPTKLSQFTNDLGLGSLAYVNSLSKSDVGLGNVENKSSATIRGEITSANVTTALGYTPYNSANFTKANIKSTLGISDWALASSKPTYTASEVGALSVNGGTLNGDITINSTDGTPALINFSVAGSSRGALSLISTGPVYYDANYTGYDIYHRGNFNPADYLPLSGGTISGSLQIGKDDNTSYKHLILSRSSHAMRLNNIADAGYLSFGAYSGGTYTAEKILEIGDYGLRYSANGGSTYYTLIHSGNIGEYKAGGIKYKDKITSQSDLDNFLEGHTFKIAQFGNISSLGFAYDDGVIMSIPWSSATEGVQLAFDESRTSPKMLMRAMSGSTWSDWKTIAFTDSNVASAYKLVDASGNDAVLITSNGSANLGLNSDGRGYILYNSANYGMIGEATGGSPRVVLSGWGGVKLRTGGKDALVVNTSGNVTIGASDLASTNYQLYVNDKIGAGLYYFAKNKTNYGYIGLASSANNDITISTDATSKLWLNGNGNTIMNYYGGNVLIGTSTDDNSGAKLQVNGDMNIPTEKAYQTNGLNAITLRASYGLYIGYGTSESYDTVIWGKDTKFVSGTNGQQRMCILNNGNVGIGTASPAYKLDVNGTARISGAVTMSSTLSVAGATTINGALTAGATTINGNLIVKGDVASA